MPQICVDKFTTIGSDNDLSPIRCQAIIWTNAEILLIGTLWTNFGEILIQIHTSSNKKMHLKMSSGKCRPFCLGLNGLTQIIWELTPTSLRLKQSGHLTKRWPRNTWLPNGTLIYERSTCILLLWYDSDGVSCLELFVDIKVQTKWPLYCKWFFILVFCLWTLFVFDQIFDKLNQLSIIHIHHWFK